MSVGLYIILELQCLCVHAIKAAGSKQNFITGIKNVLYEVVDFFLLFYSESLLAAIFPENCRDNLVLTGIVVIQSFVRD